MPWTYEPARRAGTVHLGGTFEEIAEAEREVNRGRMPERPFVLVGQQYLADPGRSKGDVHPVWTYAHVPNGYDGRRHRGDPRPDRALRPGHSASGSSRSATRTPGRVRGDNPNFVGGDILTGANTPLQILVRPRVTAAPYATGIPGVFICSAATPPGPGAHGMCGYNAAEAALRAL